MKYISRDFYLTNVLTILLQLSERIAHDELTSIKEKGQKEEDSIIIPELLSSISLNANC